MAGHLAPVRTALLAAALMLPCACSGAQAPASNGSPALTASGAPTASPTSPTVKPGLTSAVVTPIVDGDTIVVEIGGQQFKLRYIGIDTPETVDPRRPVGCFGHEASDRNHQLVDGQTVGLEKDISETDDFGRLLRYVWLGDRMVNAVLVQEGYATAATYPPDVKYADLFVSLQREARELGRGLWGPACSPTPTVTHGPGICDYSGMSRPLIKGNISLNTGEKIYHVPGGDFYDKTVIDESRGERWFCTEADAVAAGWRKSQR